MSTTIHEQSGPEEELAKFFRTYYREDLLEAIDAPSEHPSLFVEASDVYRFNTDIFDDWLTAPKKLRMHAEQAIQNVDLPSNEQIEGMNVRMVDSDGFIDNISVPDVQRTDVGRLRPVKGQINQITPELSLLKEAAFVCELCGTTTRVPQSFYESQEPHECKGCERQGPFRVDLNQSDDTPYVQIQLKQPPEDTVQGGNGHDVTIHVTDDLCDYGGKNGIHDHVGERVTVYGVVDADHTELDKGDGPPTIPKTIRAESIKLEEDVDVDYDDELEQIKELADGVDWEIPDYIDVEPDHPAWALAHSLTPGLKLDLRLAQVGLGTMAYLAGSYRMDADGTADYRGEIHMGMYGDPGTGKSTYATAADTMAPMSMRATGPDISGVGLTAAAVKDDFGGSQWTLSPGILPKANGGHAIVEEVDKMQEGDTDALHDALEYPQRIDVSKAGIDATLNTEAALLTTGNPVNGSFDRSATIGEQIGINDALITRFDLIFCLWDEVDRDADLEIAEHILSSMAEASKEQRSLEGLRDQFEPELADAPVDTDLIPKWVAAARDLAKPELPTEGEAYDLLKDWYVNTRQQNGESGTVPITARSLEAGVRLSIAFAKLRFSDRVQACDAQLAIHLSKRVMGDIFLDPTTGEFDATRQFEPNQKWRVNQVMKHIRENPRCTVGEIADAIGVSYSKVDHTVEELKKKGDVYEPAEDELEASD